jgi:ethanolamine utilization protein EutP (predicted NTPase)
MVRHAFEHQGLRILAEGPLVDSDTQKTYMVRTDALDSLSSTTTKAALQAYIRTLDQSSSSFPGIAADITGATVTETKIGILTANAVS